MTKYDRKQNRLLILWQKVEVRKIKWRGLTFSGGIGEADKKTCSGEIMFQVLENL